MEYLLRWLINPRHSGPVLAITSGCRRLSRRSGLNSGMRQ